MCLRHRGTRTLHVSNIIQPSACANPGYGKLHVGIYIAAIQDIIDRKQQQQLSQTKLPREAGGIKDDEDRNRSSGSRSKGTKRQGSKRGGQGVGKSSRFQGSAGRMGPTDVIEVSWLE